MRHEGYNTTSKAYVNAANGIVIDTPASNSGNVPFMYKYNGKELQAEEDLGWYDYGRRNYDASVGRFFNMDRLSELYGPITTYQYSGNNPVFFRDLNGDKITEGQEYFDRIYNEVGTMKEKILADQNRQLDLIFSTKGIDAYNLFKAQFESTKGQDDSGITEINNALKELIEMRDTDKVSYRLITDTKYEGAEGGVTFFNTYFETIDMIVNDETFSLGKFMHELKHGYQFLTGKISYGSEGVQGGYLYDKTDEEEAYSRGMFFGAQQVSREHIDNVTRRLSPVETNLNSNLNKNTILKYLDLFKKQLNTNANKNPATLPSQYYINWQDDYKNKLIIVLSIFLITSCSRQLEGKYIYKSEDSNSWFKFQKSKFYYFQYGHIGNVESKGKYKVKHGLICLESDDYYKEDFFFVREKTHHSSGSVEVFDQNDGILNDIVDVYINDEQIQQMADGTFLINNTHVKKITIRLLAFDQREIIYYPKVKSANSFIFQIRLRDYSKFYIKNKFRFSGDTIYMDSIPYTKEFVKNRQKLIN